MAVKAFAKNITKIQKTYGSPTPKEVELWIFRNFEHHVAQESIRKALKGMIDPTGCDLELLLGLIAFFGVAPADLGADTERRVAAAMAMTMVDNNGPVSPSGLRKHRTGCIADTGLELVAA